MVEAQSFVELGSKKDKFKSSKPKEKGNGGEDHEEEQITNGNSGNGCWKNSSSKTIFLQSGKIKILKTKLACDIYNNKLFPKIIHVL